MQMVSFYKTSWAKEGKARKTIFVATQAAILTKISALK